MVITAAYQNKRSFCIALLNHDLDANSICPGNHDVDYDYGWFYVDNGKPFRRPDLTSRADELIRDGIIVYFSSVWNTYVLLDV